MLDDYAPRPARAAFRAQLTHWTDPYCPRKLPITIIPAMPIKVTARVETIHLSTIIHSMRKNSSITMAVDIEAAAVSGYLNTLNENVAEDRRADLAVHDDAKVVAWECLKQTFRPGRAGIDEVIAAMDGEGAEGRLKYLEERLRLIQVVPPGDRVRFLLDPLAEYLAGLELVETNKGDEARWREFLAQADAMAGAPETIKGFLLAVRDCCGTVGKDKNVPEFVMEELASRAGLDPEAIERAKRDQRIQRLISLLQVPEAEDRGNAADSLRMIGPDAKAAALALALALKDKVASVRRSAADALGGIGPEAKAAVPALSEALKDPERDVRNQAAQALEQIGPAAVSVLNEALKSSERDVRWDAAQALGRMGPEAKAAIPALSEALKDPDWNVPGQAAQALVAIGPDAVPALIEALKDPDWNVHERAALALVAIGPDAVPALSEALKNEHGLVRKAADKALKKITEGESGDREDDAGPPGLGESDPGR